MFLPLIAGILGSVTMTVVMRRSGVFRLPETQMIRAIGSFYTKNMDNALVPGFIAHIAAGIGFAYLYWFLIQTAPDQVNSRIVIMVVCMLIGLVHGIIVTLFLVISVAQYHPLKEFRELQPGDMAAHIIAHFVYGVVVGLVLGFGPSLLS
ncbi:MAG: hypothetical protein KDC71_19460 [Acidobacteria bacterium]|nr:hypothetical protein [Acidobacteriota bacterium]